MKEIFHFRHLRLPEHFARLGIFHELDASEKTREPDVADPGILEGPRRFREVATDGGRILDPNNGKDYRVRLKPVEGGKKLEVRGYIGAPLLGRTQVWQRVE